MVFNPNFKMPGEDDQETKVPYDLRQIYAKLVGEHWVAICQSRAKSFYVWLDAIEDMYAVTRFKFDNPIEDEKEYKDKKDILIRLANKYHSAWTTGKGQSTEVSEIKNALRELENCLYSKMQTAGLFGRGFEYDEDEI